MGDRNLVLAAALGAAVLLGGCAQTPTATPGGAESIGGGKFSLKVTGAKGDLYRKWDEEARKLCKGDFTNVDRHAVKGADGQEYLTGMISCLPAKK